MRCRLWATAAGLALAAAAALGPTVGGAGAGVTATASCDWPMYGHDAGHSFAASSGCTTLSTLSAPSLTAQWALPTPEPVSASPTVVGGVVYEGDWAGRLYAVPAGGSGMAHPLWAFQVTDQNGVAFGRITSTAAVADVAFHRVVVFGGGATLYVLDASDGSLLTSACLDPRADPAVRCQGSDGEIEIESSPTVLVDPSGQSAQVLVGLDVHNDRNVGRTGVVSLQLTRSVTGKLSLKPQWKLDPEAGVAYTGADLLTNGSGTGNGCGGVWSSPAVDTAAGLVFFGTSSCSVDGVTSGESAWAADLATGAVVWKFGPPRTSTRLDDDFGASPNLLPGGLVGFSSKDGWYYALARRPDGAGRPALAWATQAGEPGHVQTDFAVGGIIGTPAVGVAGGQPAVFATTAISTPLAGPADDGLTPDQTLATDPARMLSVTAMRASDGAILWRSPLPRQTYAAPAYANGVVLVPSTAGFELDLLAADSGLPIGAVPLGGPPSSSPAVVGDQVFQGVGTSETDLEFKAFGASAFEPVLGSSPLSPLSGIYAFKIALP